MSFSVQRQPRRELEGGISRSNAKRTIAFGQLLIYNIKADTDFDFGVRIPQWVPLDRSSSTLDSSPAAELAPNSLGIHVIRMKEALTGWPSSCRWTSTL